MFKCEATEAQRINVGHERVKREAGLGFLCGYPISAVCLGLLRRRLRWLTVVCSCLQWLAQSVAGFLACTGLAMA